MNNLWEKDYRDAMSLARQEEADQRYERGVIAIDQAIWNRSKDAEYYEWLNDRKEEIIG